VKILRAVVVDKYSRMINLSQSQPEPIEQNHITKYGNAVKNPFCGQNMYCRFPCTDQNIKIFIFMDLSALKIKYLLFKLELTIEH
jgi:hypothetical protein